MATTIMEGISIYKSQGETPEDAFKNIWKLMQNTDNYALREEDGLYCLRLKVISPTKTEREEFENTGKYY